MPRLCLLWLNINVFNSNFSYCFLLLYLSYTLTYQYIKLRTMIQRAGWQDSRTAGQQSVKSQRCRKVAPKSCQRNKHILHVFPASFIKSVIICYILQYIVMCIYYLRHVHISMNTTFLFIFWNMYRVIYGPFSVSWYDPIILVYE